MFRRALVSVSDKQGLVDFLKPLVKEGLEVFSTGGTAKHLREAGVQVTDVSELTGFPEVMDGRVKTLHPNVHMSLLADQTNQNHLDTLKKYQLQPFDLVICNLYPFEATLEKTPDLKQWIENIDIGGPTQIRAAAKNFQSITIIVDPKDYPALLSQQVTMETRQKLAAKAFRHVSAYDSMIGQALAAEGDFDDDTLAGRKIQNLRYGENSQQSAQWFRLKGPQNGLHQAQICQGKELSYNNLLDLDAAVRCLQQLSPNQKNGVIVKHTNPCAVATSNSSMELVEKVLRCDPVSMFGGICAFNFHIDAAIAKKLSEVFLECLIAEDYSPEALTLFQAKKNLRILKWNEISKAHHNYEYRSILGGYLKQNTDLLNQDWVRKYPDLTAEIKTDALLAEVCAASLKSNAIAIVRGGHSLGFGMGQTNRVDAVQQALERAQKFHGNLRGAILASDAFFPFADSIDLIAASGIQIVVQPGGSLRDPEVLAAAEKFQIKMLLTGERHFKH